MITKHAKTMAPVNSLFSEPNESGMRPKIGSIKEGAEFILMSGNASNKNIASKVERNAIDSAVMINKYFNLVGKYERME